MLGTDKNLQIEFGTSTDGVSTSVPSRQAMKAIS